MFARTAATRVPPHVSEPGAIVRAVLGQDSVAVLSGPDLAKDERRYFAVELFAGFARFTQAPKAVGFLCVAFDRPASRFELHTPILRSNLACNTSSELSTGLLVT